MGEIAKEQVLHVSIRAGCNNYCVFCNDPRESFDQEQNSFEQYASVLRESAGSFKRVCFTAGEPTIYPRFLELIRYAKKLGYPDIFLITNGKMLSSKKFFAKLIRNGLNMLAVSVHGHAPGLHDGLTRSPGSFSLVKDALLNAGAYREKGELKSFSINSTLIRQNLESLPEMNTFFHTFSIDEHIINYFNPLCTSTSDVRRFMPQYSDAVTVFKQMYLVGQKFLVLDIPYCTCRDLLAVTGAVEDNYMKIDDIEYAHNTISKDRIKPHFCSRCRLEAQCDGIPLNYANLFGLGEFRPL
ncbi:MAG: radical SAM protein [Nanoarchaeota archaeon]